MIMLARLYKYSFVLLFFFIRGIVLPQNEIAKWYFGNIAGLDFMNNPPTVMVNGNMAAYEGCSSLADASGNVLLYSNGALVLNRLHTQMFNGTNLGGDPSSAQSCLIVKQPGNTNIYYIFTTKAYESGTHTLCYSVVDMNLSGGNGSVIAKGVTMYLNSSEKLSAVRQCNGSDYWIISQDRLTNTFRLFPFTASGIGTPVLSSAGPADLGSGSIKCSASGGRMGMTNYGDVTFTSPATPYSFALFDLDNSTGTVSNAIDLGTYSLAYGCEFSPDETKFYGTNLFGLHQWNLCAGSGAAIAASHQNIYTLPAYDTTSIIAGLQLASNGKIYVARYLKNAIGVVNAPNLAGSNCNYTDTSQSTAPKLCSGGLPNFAPYFVPNVPTFTTTINSAISCNTATFVANSVVNCPFPSYIHSVHWNFGDPLSGAANSSTLLTTTHAYQTPGSYTIQLVLLNRCGVAIDTVQQQLSVQHFSLSGNSAYTVCAGSSLTLSAPGFSNYSWSNGSTSSSIQVSPLTNTSYTVHAQDAYGCDQSAVQSVTVNPTPNIVISGNTMVCRGSALTQTASGGTAYTWSNGATTPVITVTPSASGMYSVTGTDVKGCKSTGSTSITVVNIPTLAVSNFTACNGAPTIVSASSQLPLDYVWLPGATNGPSITVTAASTQVYTVIASISSCTNSATSTITIITPDLTVPPSLTITLGNSATLQASGGQSYSWTPADYLSCAFCPDPVATPPADMKYCVTATQNSCTAHDCVHIAVECHTLSLSMPNAFTPNGDHNNDEFCLRGWECTRDFNIRIFNRWGEIVFESTDPAFCWDGSYNGTLLDAAVFVYVIHAKKIGGDVFTKKGNITLIR